MMRIEEVRIDSIEYHKKNPKQHPDKQIRLIQESIKKFGWTNPVILSADNTILAGHARVKAAIEAGNDTVPCIRTKLSGKDADAYLLADNRLSDIAPYDRDILAELLSDLPKDLVDITGFDTVQVDALLAGEDIPDIEKFISDSQPEEPREEVDAEPQIDRAAELNKKWQVKTGDMWQCGDHRVICGDCTDPAVVERLMQGEKADLVLTDPPYGISIVNTGKVGISAPVEFNGGAKGIVGAKVYSEIIGDDKPYDPVHLFSLSSTQIIFGANNFASKLPDNSHWVVWDKKCEKGADHNNFSDVELAWTNIDRKSCVIYRFLWSGLLREGCRDEELKERVHPTQKPVGLFKLILLDYSEKDDIIIDPFLGSGTTLIACENTGRKARGIEISPDYVSVCLERFKEATGKEPVRIND